MGWTRPDLNDAHRAYRVWLEARDLAKITVDSHHRYAGFFLRWLYGDYVPRGSAPRPDPLPSTQALSPDDLRAQLADYGPFLVAAGLKSSAAPTYVEGARLFLKWLDPAIVSRAGSAGRPPIARQPHALPGDRPIGVMRPAGDPSAWPSETSVQASIVTWLAALGWQIERVAHTGSREHGVDILARREGRLLAVEVKGYPSETYSAGDRAGQPRKYHPASQARTYLGDALLAVLVMRAELPDARIALALPDVGSFRGLVDKVEPALTDLGTWILLVAADGSVVERGAPRA